MKVVVYKSARVFTLALAVQFSCTLPSGAESTETPQASQVAMRGTLQTLDPSKPPAPDTIALTRQTPQTIKKLESGGVLIDFERVAFGNLELTSPADFKGTLKVRFGEKLQGDSIDRKPPGTVRYSEVEVEVAPGMTTVIAPPADERNTQQSFESRRPTDPPHRQPF